jgi:hypothetical protein
VRTNNRWVERFVALNAHYFEITPKRGEIIPKDHLPSGLPPPGVIIRGSLGMIQRHLAETYEEQPAHGYEPFGRTWASHFPSIRESERETYPYPLPTSEGFWKLYAEPLRDFLSSAWAFHNALDSIRKSYSGELTEREWMEFRWGIDGLNDFASGEARPLEFIRPREFAEGFTTPSLIGAYAVMAKQDLADHAKKLFRCQNCDQLVAGAHPRAQYCSDRCKGTAQKRQQRASRRERETAKTGGQ